MQSRVWMTSLGAPSRGKYWTRVSSYTTRSFLNYSWIFRSWKFFNIKLRFFTFFYLFRFRDLYGFVKNFYFMFLERFTRFMVSWARFDNFWKMSVLYMSVCVTKILWQVLLENYCTEFLENLYLVLF